MSKWFFWVRSYKLSSSQNQEKTLILVELSLILKCFWISVLPRYNIQAHSWINIRKAVLHITEREMGREETRTKRNRATITGRVWVSNEGWHEWECVCVCVCVWVCVCVCVVCVCVEREKLAGQWTVRHCTPGVFHFNIWGRKRGREERYTNRTRECGINRNTTEMGSCTLLWKSSVFLQHTNTLSLI